MSTELDALTVAEAFAAYDIWRTQGHSDLAPSDRSFALFYDVDERGAMWKLLFINPSHAVRLGETDGLFEAEGNSPEECFRKVIEEIKTTPPMRGRKRNYFDASKPDPVPE